MTTVDAPMATVSESSISARQTSAPASSTDEVRERARFFSGREPFKGLSQEELEDVASSIVERLVRVPREDPRVEVRIARVA